MTSKRDSRCFVLALAPDASASTRLPCLAYINVPLSTYCKIRYVLKITAASRGSPPAIARLLYTSTLETWRERLETYFLSILETYLKSWYWFHISDFRAERPEGHGAVWCVNVILVWLQMTMTLDNFDLEPGSNVDVMQAVSYAAQLPFRAGASKSLILLACSECTETKQRYSDVQRLLVNNDIHLHVLVHEILRLKSRSPKTAYIYGTIVLRVELLDSTCLRC